MNTNSVRLGLITALIFSLIFSLSAQLTGCESPPPKLSININECLSSESSTREGLRGCQEQLATYTASSPAGCFFVHVEGTYPQVTTVSRNAEGVLRPDNLNMVLREGDRFQTHLILFSATPVPITGCEPYSTRLQDECREIGQCLVKLHSTPQTYEGEAVNVSFLSEGRCANTLGSTLEGSEDIDGVDNDCDGLVDEGRGASTCEAGVGECAAEGVFELSLTGEEVCSAQVGVSSPETCLDGTDEDCDGRIDEGFEAIGEACTPEGASGPIGKLSCTGDRTRLRCVPQDEADDIICDGVDSDRDGVIDEDFIVRVEECPAGSCSSVGYVRCVEGAEVSTCQNTPSNPTVSEDLCDGVDADCDGRVDEDADNTPLSCGEGICAQAGRISCVRAELTEECMPALELSRDELCNGLDDDCDGIVDENVLNACGGCEVALLELCDGEDNDCDGRVDEEFPLLNQACTIGSGACGVQGVYQCSADPSQPPECVTDDPLPPTPRELCDGVDNDCDGRVDEQVEGVGDECSVGQGECQRSGVKQCRPDQGQDLMGLVCSATEGEPQEESNNNLDDDCDGVVDEDFEVCDALDNDGDTRVDEGLPDCPNELRSLFQISLGPTRGASAQNGLLLNERYQLFQRSNTLTPQMGDQLFLSVTLNPNANAGWHTWVQDHNCHVSLSWAESGDQYLNMNPITCQPSNVGSTQCINASLSLAVTRSVNLTITPKNYAFGFACEIDKTNDLETTQYAYLHDHLSFEVARSRANDGATMPNVTTCGLVSSVDDCDQIACGDNMNVDMSVSTPSGELTVLGEVFDVQDMDEPCAALYFKVGAR
jgi:hypothetical protein